MTGDVGALFAPRTLLYHLGDFSLMRMDLINRTISVGFGGNPLPICYMILSRVSHGQAMAVVENGWCTHHTYMPGIILLYP